MTEFFYLFCYFSYELRFDWSFGRKFPVNFFVENKKQDDTQLGPENWEGCLVYITSGRRQSSSVVKKIIDDIPISVVVEPSAGAGAFVRAATKYYDRAQILAMDIEPKSAKIKKKDFFTFNPKYVPHLVSNRLWR